MTPPFTTARARIKARLLQIGLEPHASPAREQSMLCASIPPDDSHPVPSQSAGPGSNVARRGTRFCRRAATGQETAVVAKELLSP